MAEWFKAAVLKTVERKFRGFESYFLRHISTTINFFKYNINLSPGYYVCCKSRDLITPLHAIKQIYFSDDIPLSVKVNRNPGFIGVLISTLYMIKHLTMNIMSYNLPIKSI